MRQWFENISRLLRRVITSPVGELTRAQRVMRFWIDLVWHCTRALRHDRAGEMAAALTYRTIFSLIPLLVTLLLVFQAFRGLDQVRSELEPLIYKFMRIDAVGFDEEVLEDLTPHGIEKEKQALPITPQAPPTPGAPNGNPAPPPPVDVPTTPANPTAPAPSDTTAPPQVDAQGKPIPPPADAPKVVDKQVKFRVDQFLTDLTNQVSSLDFGSIGAVGFILFIWAAIDLVVTLELSFNRVFNCPGGRPWLRRIPIYWAIITLGPVLVWLSLSVAGRLVGFAEQVPLLGVLIKYASSLFALAASWLLLFLVYKLMPNTNVHANSALAGSFVAAVLWELGKFGFGLYVSKAVPYAKIYGALGLIPLFLFWVYLTWIIVLFGLELTYTLQAMKGKRFKYELPASVHADVPGDPQWIIPIITQIGQSFAQGKPIDSQALADRLGLPDRVIVELNLKLEQAGLIHRVQGGEDADAHYALSLPPEQIRIQQLLEIADSIRHSSDPARQQAGWVMLRTLSQAQQVAAGDQTLASLLKVNGEVPSAVNAST